VEGPLPSSRAGKASCACFSIVPDPHSWRKGVCGWLVKEGGEKGLFAGYLRRGGAGDKSGGAGREKKRKKEGELGIRGGNGEGGLDREGEREEGGFGEVNGGRGGPKKREKEEGGEES